MIFLDANFLVSFYIETEEHHKRALEIMGDIKEDKKVISKLIIAEAVNILFTKIKSDKDLIKRVYEELNNEYNVIDDFYFYDKTIKKIMDANKRFPFFDYVFITLMGELGIEKIATFDKHFNNIEGIERIC